MEIKRIEGNTFCIDTGRTFIPFYKVNYREIIMLDSGIKAEKEGIVELLEANNLKVTAIICTHAHRDHIGNASYLKEKYNCIVAMSDYEAFICSSITNLKFYYYSKYTLSEIAKYFSYMVCKTDMMITSTQKNVYVCGIKFKIIHTPGHTLGHICIVTPDNVAYLGDALVGYEVTKQAKILYSYLLTEDLKSKEKLYDLKCSQYVAAHKGIYNDITKLIENNIDFYKNAVNKVYDIIGRNGSMSMEEIFKSVTQNFNIHLNNRYKYGVIERIATSYVEYLNEKGMLNLNMENGFYKYSRKPFVYVASC